MKTAIQIINELEDFWFASIEIEMFGVHTYAELDELIDMEIDTWSDLDATIEELEILAIEAGKSYFGSCSDPDRLQECICIYKSIHFLKELRELLTSIGISLPKSLK